MKHVVHVMHAALHLLSVAGLHTLPGENGETDYTQRAVSLFLAVKRDVLVYDILEEPHYLGPYVERGEKESALD